MRQFFSSNGIWFIMKIYDISQEVFSCEIYPGDPAPERRSVASISRGNAYNLTEFSMCAHNGTHIDAPFHFINEGKAIDGLPLSKTVGKAFVAAHEGIMSASDAEAIIKKAEAADAEAKKRILIKGSSVVTLGAARVFAEAGLDLLGTESQSVGPADSPMQVHLELLGAEVVLLEGIRLSAVPEGVCFLSAAPLLLAGSDGAPCRAFVIA